MGCCALSTFVAVLLAGQSLLGFRRNPRYVRIFNAMLLISRRQPEIKSVDRDDTPFRPRSRARKRLNPIPMERASYTLINILRPKLFTWKSKRIRRVRVKTLLCYAPTIPSRLYRTGRVLFFFFVRFSTRIV